jgi:TolA-binding protein
MKRRPSRSVANAKRLFISNLCLLCALTSLACSLRPALADTPDEQFSFATDLYRKKLYGLAAEKLRDFLAANPKNEHASVAAYQLAAALYRTTDEKDNIDYAAAAAAYERALAQYTPPNAKVAAAARFELGEAYHSLKQPEKTIKAETEFLKNTPDDKEQIGWANYYIGDSYAALKKPAEAKTAYQKVLTQAGDSEAAPWAQYAIGVMAADNGQSEAAAAAFSSLIEHYPKAETATEARLRLADAQLALKQFDKATASYQAVYDDPKAAEWKNDALLGLADAKFGAKSYADAAGDYSRLLTTVKADDPRRNIIQLRLADSYYNAKDYAKAAAAYKPLIQVNDPKIAPNALYFGANALREQKQLTEAASLYSQLLDSYPQNAWAAKAALRLGDTLADNKEPVKAAAAYKTVITKYGNSAADKETVKDAEAALAALAGEVATGQGDAAHREGVEKVLQSLPASVAGDAQLRLAQAAFDRQDWAQAASLAQTVLNGKPGKDVEENALFLQASAKLNANEAAAAAPLFRKLLATNPQGKLVRRARLGLALALLDAKQWTDAEAAARAGLQAVASGVTPDDPKDLKERLNLALGEALLRGNKAKEAGPVFTSVTGSPDKELASQGAYGAALSYEAEQQWQAAAAQWTKYADLSTDTKGKSQAYYRQGLAWNKAKEPTKALAAFEQAVVADPKSDDAPKALYEGAWTAHDLKQKDDEAKWWKRLETEYPASEFAAEAAFQQGELASDAKAWTDAAADYRRVTDKYPQSKIAPDAWYQLGTALYNEKQWADAAAAFDNVAKTADHQSALEANYWAAESWRRAGKTAEARPRFEAFIAGVGKAGANAKNLAQLKLLVPGARLRIGQALAADGNLDAAVAAYNSGLNAAEGATKSELYYSLGQAYDKQGKPKDAALSYLQVEPTSEWGQQAQWAAGQALEKDGRKSAAVKVYKDLATATPATDLSRQAQERVQALGAVAANG